MKRSTILIGILLISFSLCCTNERDDYSIGQIKNIKYEPVKSKIIWILPTGKDTIFLDTTHQKVYKLY